MKLFFFLFLFSSCLLHAQFTEAIEDNSFFIEEAYNQEDGIVQHIFTGTRNSGAVFTEASFTQEWPVFGQTHQVSYTLPYLFNSSVSGAGDVLLNYRYQFVNNDGLAISPRFSLIIPTGNDVKGLGSGVVGVQLNAPVSKRWTNAFISHFNAGVTILPQVKIGTEKETQTEYFIGTSGIYLADTHVNIMTEVLYTFGNGNNELILNPGVRIAIDIDNLQIVPGLAFPIIFTSGRQESGMFLYLSFEHPF